MKPESLRELISPDSIGVFNTRQVILYENLSGTGGTEMTLGNATQIFINVSSTISIVFAEGRGKKSGQQITGVKQLYLNKKVEARFIYTRIGATTDPQGNALKGFVNIYASGSDRLATPFWTIDYLPSYAHLALDTWGAAATSAEFNLDMSSIAVSNVILTRWKGTIGAATLIRDVLLKYRQAGGTRSMIFRVDNAATGAAGGAASNFDLIFNPGIIMPADFEYHYLGSAPAGATAIAATLWMKLL